MLLDKFIKTGQDFLGCKFPIMAGQSVGLVDKIKPIQGIIDEMVEDAQSELQRLNKIFMKT